jgi:predicted lipid-binding transport protein (Tim44 family)
MPPNPNIEPCPHCGTNADVARDSDLRYKCQICGRARIPLDKRLAVQSQQTNALLKDANRARVARIVRQIGGVVMAGFSGLSLLTGMMFFLLTDWLGVGGTFTGFGLIAALLTVLAFSSARKVGAQSQHALEEAWKTAAARIYQRLGSNVTAKQLAETMGIDVDYATQLLAEAEVTQLLATDLEDAPHVRVRVADGSSEMSERELEARALEEAERALGEMPTQAIPARKD